MLLFLQVPLPQWSGQPANRKERKFGSMTALRSIMANLPSISSNLALHLSDRAGTPIISSSRSPSTSLRQGQAPTQAQALSSLTSVAITAFDSASRLGLGIPQRIMIEMQSSGPVILHSYLTPQSTQRPPSRRLRGHETEREIVEQAREELRPLSATSDSGIESAALVNGVTNDGQDSLDETEDEETETRIQQPPLLVSSVVAPSAADTSEARRAAARLERTGRDFQREWVREQEEAHLEVTQALNEDG